MAAAITPSIALDYPSPKVISEFHASQSRGAPVVTVSRLFPGSEDGVAKDSYTAGWSVARLGKSSVEAAPVPAAGGRTVLRDAEVKGFGVRVAPSGARTYVLSYRMGGREAPKRTATIGRHGSPWATDQARRRALELLALVRQGVDPVAEREQAREAVVEEAERRAARSFDLLADRWMREHVRRSGLRSLKDVEGVVERDLKPAFAGRSVDDITRAEVAEALEGIGGRSEAAVVGTSRLEASISPVVLQRTLSTELHRPVATANLSLVHTGRDLHYEIVRLLLDHYPAVRVIALALDGDTMSSHPSSAM